jgi:hypothetical protein
VKDVPAEKPVAELVSQPAQALDLNLRDFLNHLVARGRLAGSAYLTSVQAGTEVFIGTGRLDTTAYATTVS